MRTYICLHCGHHFSCDEIVAKYYDRATGTYDREECPACGSEDFEEAGHCLKCGDYFPVDDLNSPENYMVGSICRCCVEKRMTLANAFAYALDREIDIRELDGATESDARKFCAEDIYDFSEWLEAQDDA